MKGETEKQGCSQNINYFFVIIIALTSLLSNLQILGNWNLLDSRVGPCRRRGFGSPSLWWVTVMARAPELGYTFTNNNNSHETLLFYVRILI